MPLKHSFNVSQSKGGPQHKGLTIAVGSTVDDPAWQDLNVTQADMNGLAIRSVVIDLQQYLRANWSADKAEMQEKVDNWARGKRASYQKARLSADKAAELGYSEDQLAHLRAIGVDVESL